MNIYLILAGLIAAATALFHVVAGGARVVRPVLASNDINDTVKAVVYGCWHAFTLLYLVAAAGFLWASVDPGARMLAQVFTLAAAGLSLLSALVIVRFKQRFRRLPHWLLFALAALAGAAGVAST